MNVSDWQHAENRKRADKLREMGFELEITATGYSVRFKGQWIHGAATLPRDKPMHWRHRDANLRDYLAAAIVTAERSKQYQELSATPATAS